MTVEGACILWTKVKDKDGYGLRWDLAVHRNRPAHRMAYEEQIGPIPEGYEIDHLCLVKACINVNHLEAVTREENQRRMNAQYTACCHGHPYVPENIYVYRGWRCCRTCRRDSSRRHYAKRKVST